MKFRRRAEPTIIGFQIAPIVDVLLVLLCFFIITWNFAKTEMELDVKVPAAESGKEGASLMNQTVLNVRMDGTVVWNRNPVTLADLQSRLKDLVGLYPDYAIILRGDGRAPYQQIVRVLDTCREAGVWNVAFATMEPTEAAAR